MSPKFYYHNKERITYILYENKPFNKTGLLFSNGLLLSYTFLTLAFVISQLSSIFVLTQLVFWEDERGAPWCATTIQRKKITIPIYLSASSMELLLYASRMVLVSVYAALSFYVCTQEYDLYWIFIESGSSALVSSTPWLHRISQWGCQLYRTNWNNMRLLYSSNVSM